MTAPDIRARKGAEPIVMLTSYHAHTARLLDEHVDLMLVGDSLGMVMHGMESTLPVTLEMMILQGHAVMRGSKRALVVIDMPFGSYQESPEQAFRNAARLMAEAGCQAVKFEGGDEMAETAAFLVRRGIPVMGHIGLQPQSVHGAGGYHVTGRKDGEQKKLLADAKALSEAGAFSIVLECMDADLASAVTAAVPVPTIGIGAGVACDGQILVCDDVLGLSSGPLPRFVKRYAEVSKTIDDAFGQYAAEVRNRRFPSGEHSYQDKKKLRAVD